jgi:hypothetical protein
MLEYFYPGLPLELLLNYRSLLRQSVDWSAIPGEFSAVVQVSAETLANWVFTTHAGEMRREGDGLFLDALNQTQRNRLNVASPNPQTMEARTFSSQLSAVKFEFIQGTNIVRVQLDWNQSIGFVNGEDDRLANEFQRNLRRFNPNLGEARFHAAIVTPVSVETVKAEFDLVLNTEVRSISDVFVHASLGTHTVRMVRSGTFLENQVFIDMIRAVFDEIDLFHYNPWGFHGFAGGHTLQARMKLFGEAQAQSSALGVYLKMDSGISDAGISLAGYFLDGKDFAQFLSRETINSVIMTAFSRLSNGEQALRINRNLQVTISGVQKTVMTRVLLRFEEIRDVQLVTVLDQPDAIGINCRVSSRLMSATFADGSAIPDQVRDAVTRVSTTPGSDLVFLAFPFTDPEGFATARILSNWVTQLLHKTVSEVYFPPDIHRTEITGLTSAPLQALFNRVSFSRGV